MSAPMTNDKALEAALLPCPFCGGEPRISTYETESLWSNDQVTYTKVECSECEISFQTEPGYDPEAIDAWNRRAPSASMGRVTVDPRKLPDIDPEFIVICQSAWMNDSGYGIGYDWDRQRFNNRADAIKHGWKLRGSDDFNIGQTYGDDLIWFGWMDGRIDEDEATMREIAAAIGLTFDPRWHNLNYSRSNGRATGFRETGHAD